MFGIPAPEAVVGTNCADMAAQAKVFFARPDEFAAVIDQRIADQRIVLSEELLLADGRVFERDYIPVSSGQRAYGHYWIYRDITNRRREKAMLQYKTIRSKP